MTNSRHLGSLEVFPLALGCMGMSGMYGPTDEKESVATIHAALDANINLLDTGDFYGMGHNEMLIGRAMAGRGEKPLLSVKFGSQRAPNGVFLGFDARPSAVKNGSRTHCSGSRSTTSTSTGPARLDQVCRSKRPSARSVK